MQTGTVVEIDGTKVLWKCDNTGEFLIDEMRKLTKV
tara:strand:- start:493 stop:600 length:108 start_codon:yes stop_codon:yes gene_type:complete